MQFNAFPFCPHFPDGMWERRQMKMVDGKTHEREEVRGEAGRSQQWDESENTNMMKSALQNGDGT